MTTASRRVAASALTASTTGAGGGAGATGGAPPIRRLVRLGLSALGAARVAVDTSTALMRPIPALERANFHGRTVSLRGGVGAAAGAIAASALCAPWRGRATASRAPQSLLSVPSVPSAERAELGAVALAALVATTAGAGAGLADDLDAGAHDGQETAKGLAGHLRALGRGHVTTGVLKIAVIGAGAAVAGALLSGSRAASAGAMPSGGLGGHVVPAALTAASRHRPRALARLADAAGSAVVVASWANVINLLDLRPGRALKAAGAGAALLLAAPGRAPATRRLAAGALGTVAAALPEDLGERTMLGDTGANALGALLGTALAAHPSRALRLGAGAAGVALILTSERVSFSRVIERTPVLAALDALGRRSAPSGSDPGTAQPGAPAAERPAAGTPDPAAPAAGPPGTTTAGAG